MKYMVYCPAGAGGHFLTCIIANFLGMNITPNLSSTGHSRDLGHGDWKGHSDNINFVGDYGELNFNPKSKIFYTHKWYVGDFKKEQLDQLKVILIDVDREDYDTVTKMYVCKAWPWILTPEEYEKWKGTSWPEYSTNVIAESEIVRKELISGLSYKITDWMQGYDRSVVDFSINFKTIMGVNDSKLTDILSKFLNAPTNDRIESLVKEYQDLNRRLYFDKY